MVARPVRKNGSEKESWRARPGISSEFEAQRKMQQASELSCKSLFGIVYGARHTHDVVVFTV